MSENRIHAAHPSFNESLLSASPERAVAAFVECGDLSVDELGRVWRHIVRVGAVRKEKILNPPKRTETMQVQGYTHVKVNILGSRVVCKTHRLVWFLHNGEIPDGCDIHHINEVRHDNRLSNLACLTRRKHQLLHNADEDADASAYALNRSGLPKAAVARIMSVSPSTVRGKVLRHIERTGLPVRTLGSQVMSEKAYTLCLNGMTLREVAEIMGITITAVSQRVMNYCREQGISNPVQDRITKSKDDTDRLVFNLYVAGMSQAEIADRLRTSVGRVSSRLKRYCTNNNIDNPTGYRAVKRDSNERTS